MNPKLSFQVGDTKEVKFHKYNQGKHYPPKEEGWSDSYLYGVEVNGVEYSWFASANTNQILQDNNLQVGDVVTVARVAEKQYVYTRNGQILMKKEGSQPASNAPSGDLEIKLNTLILEVNTLKGRMDALSPQTPTQPQNSPNTAPPQVTVEDVEKAFGEEENKTEDIPF